MKNILILGSEGFIGKNLTNHLSSKKNYKIYKLSLSLGNDLRERKVLDFFLNKKINTIINLAGHTGGIHYFQKNFFDVYKDNLLINLNIIFSLKNYKKKINVINILPNCMYDPHYPLQEEKNLLIGDVHSSVECYALPKRFLISLGSKLKNVCFVNLIFGGVYGPGDNYSADKSHALNAITSRMIKSKKTLDSNFEVWGTGKPIREWIYIDDVSKVVSQFLKKEKFIENKVINVPSETCLSIKKMSFLIKKKVNFTGKLLFNRNYKDGSLKKQFCNKSSKKYFQNFKFTKFEDGLAKTIKHYLKVN